MSGANQDQAGLMVSSVYIRINKRVFDIFGFGVMVKRAQLKNSSNTLEPDRSQHDHAHHLYYRPAVFFRHLHIIVLSLLHV
jgi:hypothetical protein